MIWARLWGYCQCQRAPLHHRGSARVRVLDLGLKMFQRNLMPGNLLMALSLDPLLMPRKASSWGGA